MTVQSSPRFRIDVDASTISSVTTVLGAGGLSSALIMGYIPPSSPIVWPLVVLVAIGAAYDLGCRALASRSTS